MAGVVLHFMNCIMSPAILLSCLKEGTQILVSEKLQYCSFVNIHCNFQIILDTTKSHLLTHELIFEVEEHLRGEECDGQTRKLALDSLVGRAPDWRFGQFQWACV